MILRYIGKRVLQTLIVLFFVSIFAFLLIRMASGSPARMMLPDDATEEQVAAMEEKLGLDKPLYQQYFIYISGVLQGDLGTSTIYKQPVADIIANRLPVTAQLTFWTILAAEITRIGRSGMIDVLKEDYITATYAKGMSRREVLWKYAFKNALIPIITLVGVQIGVFLAGTVVVETIFSWSGLGQLVNQAVSTRDYQLVQSSLLIIAAMFAIINLLVDIINSIVDPRITLE